MEKMVGAIYAVPLDKIYKLFDGKSKVFVKVTGHRSTKLLPKHKIVFYESRGNKKIVGEGIVVTVEFLTPEEVLEKYQDELFISEEEFADYIGKRHRVLTLRLKGLKRYSQPIQSKTAITMGGKYLTAKQYDLLFQETG